MWVFVCVSVCVTISVNWDVIKTRTITSGNSEAVWNYSTKFCRMIDRPKDPTTYMLDAHESFVKIINVKSKPSLWKIGGQPNAFYFVLESFFWDKWKSSLKKRFRSIQWLVVRSLEQSHVSLVEHPIHQFVHFFLVFMPSLDQVRLS